MRRTPGCHAPLPLPASTPKAPSPGNSIVSAIARIAIAALSQLAENAQSVIDSIGGYATYLPSTGVVVKGIHYAIAFLAGLGIYTRIRRALKGASG